MVEAIGRLIAAGNVAEVFEWGFRILKLYRSAAAKQAAFREAANHAPPQALGPPVPAIWCVQQIGDRWGIVFDRVSGSSYAERMRENPGMTGQCLVILARLQARIHRHSVPQFGSVKARLAANILRAEPLEELQKQL